ncbi:MAG: PAS domain S-box-containing protein [Cyclobacteriaceae bacterium]|jgi:PAS domain S-box-containing protein
MPRSKFRKLGLFYFVALGGIALSIVISQFLIQSFISKQEDDSRVINVAGRQRMLSQKISKISLQVLMAKPDELPSLANKLTEALGLWKKSHHGLLHGDVDLELHGNNSERVKSMFGDIESHFNIMVSNADSLTFYLQDHNQIHSSIIDRIVAGIISHEEAFLVGMDKIVFQYDHEARQKVDELKKTEVLLFIFSLLIISLELMFIFRPIAKSVRATVLELMQSETESKKLANELSKLYEELGKSYQDLEAVNIKPESLTIFATIDPNGKFLTFSDKLKRLMEYEEMSAPENFSELLKFAGYHDEFYPDLMRLLAAGKNWSGEIRLVSEPGDFCWIETFLIPVNDKNEIKIIARDITEIKEAQLRSREINRESIAETVKEQSYRSVLILEGQEEERKRLSRELHDGVGQMLSAMKMLLESITPSAKPMKMRMDDARSLMKSIIQEVRRVSFNLTPSSLDDFGLVPAVKKFCEEINSVTKTDIEFINETKFVNRLESHMETNLYRIIQESVNNALKYSKASKISIRFYHNVNTLNIEISDNGKGFDYERMNSSGHFEKIGHGIFNMRERAAFIGAIFKLDTEIGKGTQITITLTLE